MGYIRDRRESDLEETILDAARHNNLEKVKTFIVSGGESPKKFNWGRENMRRDLADIAVEIGSLDMLKYLVESDPSLLEKNSGDDSTFNPVNTDTLLETAVKHGQLDIVKYLVENLNQDIFEEHYGGPEADYLRSPLRLAISTGHVNILEYFIESGHVDVDTGTSKKAPLYHHRINPLIFQAVMKKQRNITRYLINKKKANLSVVDRKKRNILYIAIGNKDLKFIKYVLDKKKAQIDINWRDKYGQTLVYAAVAEDCLDILQYLVEQKRADVNIPENEKNHTPLHKAMTMSPFYDSSRFDSSSFKELQRFKELHFEVFKFLVDHGADLEKKDKDGATPLHLALHYEWRNKDKKFEYLVEHGANLKQENNDAVTPFDIAIASNCLETGKYFVERVDGVDEKNSKGETLVHRVAMFGQVEFLDQLVSKKHANVNVAREGDQWTPLHCAAFRNRPAICKYLVEHGADPRAKDKAGRSPAQLASEEEVIHCIQNASAKIRSRRSVGHAVWIPVSQPEIRDHIMDRVAISCLKKTTSFVDKTRAFDFDSFFFFISFLIQYLSSSVRMPEVEGNRIEYLVAENAVHSFPDNEVEEEAKEEEEIYY